MIALHTSKLTPLGRNRFALEAGIGARWHSVDGGPLIETDPTLVNVGGIWRPRAAPYEFRFGADKSRRIYPDRTDPGRYLHLPMPAMLNGLDPVVVGSEITFTAPNGRFQVVIATGIQGMSFRVVFNSEPPPPFQTIRLPVDTTGGLDILALLGATEGLGIPKPRLVDANDVVKPLAWKYANGELSLDLDFSGMTFPVTLYNTTIDLQTGTSADDGRVQGASGFSNSTTTMSVGSVTASGIYHAWYRFTGITIPQSSVIDVAYISLYEDTSAGTPLTKIYADDQNNPTAVANYADYGARTLTTAGVDMDGDPGADGWYNSPSIVSVAQELVDSYDYNNQAIQIMHKDDGSTGTNYRRSRSYDNTTAPANTWGPQLHIEYTAGGATEYITPTGGITPAGALGFKPSIFALGGLTPNAVLIWKPSTIYTGALTPTGAVQKLVSTSYTGALSLAGVLVREPQVVLSGAISATGDLVKRVAAIYAGAITPTGNMVHAVALVLIGAITPSGNLVKSVSHAVTGVLAPAGDVTLMITLTLAHYLVLARKIFKI